MAKQNSASCLKCEKNFENIKRVGNYCNNCYNENRREKYTTNIVDARKKANQRAIILRQKNREKINEQKEAEKKELEYKIGENNTICKYCNKIVEKNLFRKNRLKCLICERETYNKVYLPKILERLKTDSVFKFKRTQRTRIISKIKKQKKTIEYLGCSSQNFVNWLSDNSSEFTIDNHGDTWHIDHVIPLCLFNLENEDEQLLAFNWRNTMPLSCDENLKKGNKIIPSQIENHLNKLILYHTKNNLDLPQEYINLFAKHLVVRGVP
jgi:hypothetical protein